MHRLHESVSTHTFQLSLKCLQFIFQFEKIKNTSGGASVSWLVARFRKKQLRREKYSKWIDSEKTLIWTLKWADNSTNTLQFQFQLFNYEIEHLSEVWLMRPLVCRTERGTGSLVFAISQCQLEVLPVFVSGVCRRRRSCSWPIFRP